MKRCNYCRKTLSFSAFAEHKGRLLATCEACRPKKNAVNTKYSNGNAGTKTRSVYWSSAPGKKVRKKYNASDGMKTSLKKWSDSDKGKAYKVDRNLRQSKNYHTKPGQKLNLKLCAAFKSIMKQQYKTCSHLKYTKFKSIKDVFTYFKSQLHKLGDAITMSDHGSLWSVGHRIPRIYFDHTNMEDVKKCWSKANMFPQSKKANQEDSYFITNENCSAVGADHFPASWNGVVPSDAEIAVMHASAHAGGF